MFPSSQYFSPFTAEQTETRDAVHGTVASSRASPHSLAAMATTVVLFVLHNREPVQPWPRSQSVTSSSTTTGLVSGHVSAPLPARFSPPSLPLPRIPPATIIARTRTRRLLARTTYRQNNHLPWWPRPFRRLLHSPSFVSVRCSWFYVRGPRNKIHLRISILRCLRHRSCLWLLNANQCLHTDEIPRYNIICLKKAHLKRRFLYMKWTV